MYFDCASTTPIDDDIIPIVSTALKNNNYNPSSIYYDGRKNFELISNVKENIKSCINAENKNQIFFTSGGTEGNNWIIRGYIDYLYKTKECYKIHKDYKPHIITDTIEHHSVLNTCKFLEELGLIEVTYLKPNIQTGTISYEEVCNHIQHNTELVSIMFANNVLGTYNDIKLIGKICKEKNIKFHTDAVQAIGKKEINIKYLNVDFLTCSGHKIHTPKGIGFVYIKEPKKICPLLHGGLQEFGLRAGTENIPYIQALDYCIKKYTDKEYLLIKNLVINEIQRYLIKQIRKGFTNKLIFQGNNGTINIAFKDINSDTLVWELGLKNVFVSVGSACDNGSLEDNYVLKEMYYPPEFIKGNIRITFDENNSLEECEKMIDVLQEIVKKQRGYL